MKFYAFNQSFGECDEEEFYSHADCASYVRERNNELGGHYIIYTEEQYKKWRISKDNKRKQPKQPRPPL